MPSVQSSTMQKLTNIIKKFRFEELETSVMPTFPELSWNNIKTELVKRHKNFNSTNVAQFIKLAITEAQLQEKKLKDRISTLEVIDISRHSNRKIWYGYMFTGSSNKPIDLLINREIQDSITKYFHSSHVTVSVKLVTYNGITYVSVKEQKKKSKVLHTTPTFFAFFLGQKHFFCSKKNVPKVFITGITISMGYEKFKKLKLSGRDLRSLSKLCWRRKQGALNPENIDKAPVYRDAPPDIKNTGVVCTQHKQRRKYAEKCFGDDPPTLESIVINGPDQAWKDEDIARKLPDEDMQVSWEFRSHNVATTLTKLIERRILVTPVPYYISNFMTLGKNELTLQQD